VPEPHFLPRPTVLTVDLDAVVSNAKILSRTAGGRPILAVVKANAYGMGVLPVARALRSLPEVAWLGVALVEEGVQLRRAGDSGPLLLLGPAAPSQAPWLLEEGLTPAVYSIAFLEALEEAASRKGCRCSAHLKIDSGMGRLGFRPEEIPGLLGALHRTPHVEVEGLFSNLASADDPASPQSAAQLETFLEVLAAIRKAGHEPRWIGLANSSAVLAHPSSHLKMVRPGLTLYGMKPSAALPDPGLRPAATLRTRIAQVKDLPAGAPVGYGATYLTPSRRPIGILPLGYADGLPRCAQGEGYVLVQGARCPIVGRVSMDLAAVDLEPAGGAVEGSAVTLWGTDGGESLGPWDWARWAGTIPYEIMTGIGCRVARRYLQQGREWIEPPLGL
jgi:alanine racemase